MQVSGKRITADITDTVASQRRALARSSQRSSDRDTHTIRKFEDYHDKTSVYAICQYFQYTGWAKKWVDRLMTTILSNLVITVRFLGKFAVKSLLKIPPHLAYVATLSCETLLCQQNKPLTINYKVVYLHI